MLRQALVFTLVALATSVGVAAADPITDPFNQAVYTLTVATDASGVPISSGTTGAGGSIYSFTLTVDTDNFAVNGSVPPIYLQAVAIKVGSLDTTFSPSLSTAPGGASAWDVVFGQTTNGGGSAGCTANAANGFVCAQTDAASTTVAPVPSIADHVFTFNLALDDVLLGLPDDSSVKAVYCDSDGSGATCNVGSLRFLSQTSINVPTQSSNPPLNGVSEPATLLLLGAGLVGTAFIARRRR